MSKNYARRALCPHCGWGYSDIKSAQGLKGKKWWVQCTACAARGPESYLGAANASELWELRREAPPPEDAKVIKFERKKK